MVLDSFSNTAIFSLSAVIVFFLGFSAFIQINFQYVAFIIIFTLIIILSLISLHPLRGALVGFFIGGSFLFGHLVYVVIKVLLLGVGNEVILGQYISLDPVDGRFLAIASAFFGLASLGFLSGLIGYIFNEISPVDNETNPLMFRDYWSQIYGWNKSGSPEYAKLDQKLANWSVVRGSWKQLFLRKIREPKEELLFIPNNSGQNKSNVNNQNNKEIPRGELYLATSNVSLGEFVDYNYLISKYRPKLIHDLNSPVQLVLSKKLSGVFWLALERILTKIIEYIVNSKKIILLYSGLSLATVFGTVYYLTFMSPYQYPLINIFITIFATGIPALGPLIMGWLFRRKSKDLISSRPDEIYLIFAIFLCLVLIYPVIIWIGLNPPSTIYEYLPTVWINQWFWNWSIPFSIISIILGTGYIFFHRETQNISTYFFDNRAKVKNLSETLPLKNNEGIYWIKKKKQKSNVDPQYFWVIRFMYYWRFEFTLPLPHPDWERVELWIDAKKGDLEWIVSDYHYKELWYKVKKELPAIYVKILTNWHTPIPVIDFNEAEKYENFFNKSKWSLLKYFLKGLFGKLNYFLGEILSEIKKKIMKVLLICFSWKPLGKLRPYFSIIYKKIEVRILKTPKKPVAQIESLTKEKRKKARYEAWIRKHDRGNFADVLEKIPYEEIRYIRGVDSEKDGKKFSLYKTYPATEKI